ncbi:MAG: glycosyltransferase family 4 protein [Saprospirales bacterium]|nr:glycosyltransferase family 4 protein [Saprospirales bacterium]
MKKLAILSTHPIQYYAPVFRLITGRGKISLKVFYTKAPEATLFDKGFGRKVEWDIPLLDGYEYEFPPPSQKLRRTQPVTSHKSLITSYAPDALLVFGWNFPGHLKLMRHFHGKIPVWFRGDSTLLDEKAGLKTLARRLFLRWVYGHVDKAFYVGSNNKAYFRAHGLREDQLVFSPHAIDNERFVDSPERAYEVRAKAWRTELGLSEHDTVILFAGKLEPKKDPLLLIEAVQGLNAGLSRPLKLVLVGTGVLENAVREKVSADKNLRWLGFQNQSQMPVVYRLGDVYCLPSKGPGETWGLAVNEAMACSRPAIASDRCGCAVDLIRDGETGFSFKANSLSSLQEALKNITASNLDKLGRNALGHIQDWSFSSQVLTFENQLKTKN